MRRTAIVRPFWSIISWPMAVMLFGYAVFFSYAYRDLTAATGALLLFGAVQLTMMSWALWQG